MPFQVRFTTPDDVPQCAALSRDAVALSSADNMQRVGRWKEWLQEGHALSAVVVDESDHVVAFGLSVCISDGLRTQIWHGNGHVETCIQNALNRSTQRTSHPVLARHEIIKAHRDQNMGLNLLGFYGWRTDLPEERVNRAGRLLVQSFLHLHRGIHLKSFTKEVYGDMEVQGYVRMGCEVLRRPERFPPNTQRWKPYIVGADRDGLLGTGRFHQYLYEMFCYGAPSLHLERSQLELVQLAYLMGLNDEEILTVPEMQPRPKRKKEVKALTPETQMVLIRQRWCRLYEKLDREGIQWHRLGRNNQRHDFLQYVGKPPEVAMPLLIGSYFYRHPDMARRFPILVE
ncbi:MAG: hypothetical protein KatS3mg022_1169 [Armatimonadota bacterium]|nr:MAG: hypothetical protein KatS3mg022_1169 [Armatimonadota bacterium]